MRWVLILLVLANVAYFIWGAWFQAASPTNRDGAPAADQLDPEVPALQLLSERSAVKGGPEATGVAGVAERSQAASPEPAGNVELASDELMDEVMDEPLAVANGDPSGPVNPASPGVIGGDAAAEGDVAVEDDVAAEGDAEPEASESLPLPEPEPAIVQQASGDAGQEAAEPLCWMLGPMPEEVTGKQVASRFQALELELRIVNVEIVTGQEYWVYLGPFASQSEALGSLKGLQAEGIDSYVHASGELKNAVSLGYFSREDSARSALEQFRGKGYQPEMTIKDQKISQLWGVIPVSLTDQLSDAFWTGLAADFVGLERKQNLCSAIASAGVLE